MKCLLFGWRTLGEKEGVLRGRGLIRALQRGCLEASHPESSDPRSVLHPSNISGPHPTGSFSTGEEAEQTETRREMGVIVTIFTSVFVPRVVHFYLSKDVAMCRLICQKM